MRVQYAPVFGGAGPGGLPVHATLVTAAAVEATAVWIPLHGVHPSKWRFVHMHQMMTVCVYIVHIPYLECAVVAAGGEQAGVVGAALDAVEGTESG